MYNLEVFTDQFEYVAFDLIDDRQTIDLDYLTYSAYTITTRLNQAQKGYFIRITKDNEHVASGYIADVQPGKTTQEISIKPLQSLFDAEVFYTPVTDCITWLATNIQAAFMNNADTLQNRPITLTYTPSANNLPLTGFNLHTEVNILSVIISALKTYGVVCEMTLDVTNKRITVDIAQQTATQTIEANLENIIEKSVTLGDSYGSLNKMIIRKTDKDTGANLGEHSFYLHPNGTIDRTNNNRIYPVFWDLETLETEDDQTATQWLNKATERAKEVLTPEKYDNEILLTYKADDMLTHPLSAEIGTATDIYFENEQYGSILTGKTITGEKVTLIYGVVRTDLTKKIAMRNRETFTFETTVNAVMQNVAANFERKGSGGGTPSSTTPLMDGTATVGTETAYARGDHVHPSDTSRVSTMGDTLTGNYRFDTSIDETAAAPAENQYTQQIYWANTATQTNGSIRTRRNTDNAIGLSIVSQRQVNGSGVQNNLNLYVTEDGTRSVVVSDKKAWRDGIDAAPIGSPAFTGNPTAPTQAAGNNSTRIATTAFVNTALTNALGKQILSVQNVTLATTASVSVGSTANTTGTITAATGATDYILIPRICNYGIFTALSRSGTTINATLRNISNAAHTLGATVTVIAIK